MDSLSSSEDEFPGLGEIWPKRSSTSRETTAPGPAPNASDPSPSKSQTASVVRRRKLGRPDDDILLSRWTQDLTPHSERRPSSCRIELLGRNYSNKPRLRSRPGKNGIKEPRPKAEGSTSGRHIEQVSEEGSDWSQENENLSSEDEPLNNTSSRPVAKRAVFQRAVPTTLTQELSKELPCQKGLCSSARKPAGHQWRCNLPGTSTASVAPIGCASSSLLESESNFTQPGQGTSCRTAPQTPTKNQRSSLISPREKPRTPKPPHRPSMDLFWSQEFVDDWNEEYSPEKLADPVIARPTLKGSKKIETKASPLKVAKKSFQQARQRVAQDFLQELDAKITKGEMATLTSATGGVKIIWSHKLNTTAGRAHWKRESTGPGANGAEVEAQHRHHASIELAEKVIDDENRLLNVIAHEFCHLANFMISGVTTNPHGKEFKRWATKCSNMFSERGILVTTKHSYDIAFKYTWECTGCGNEYKRHSKSIDPERQRCGSCKSVLKQTKPIPRVGKQSDYQKFVSLHMKKIKEQNPGSPQKEVMRLVAQNWAKRSQQLRGHIPDQPNSQPAMDDVALRLAKLELEPAKVGELVTPGEC